MTTVESEAVNERTIEALLALSDRLTEREAALDAAEGVVSQLKREVRALEEEDIPNLLIELGVDEFKFSDGRKVTMKAELEISIPESNRIRCWDWMTRNNHDGLIKTMVICSYGRGELSAAEQRLLELRKAGVEATLKREVHPMTLKAWGKEQLTKNADLPGDIFSYRTYTKAQVKAPKGKE